MTKKEKLEYLLATARAFYDRGSWLQYDQLSMDRDVQVSPRRWVFASPEMATPETPVFLDCSSFCWACYYQTFDYLMEADLTWNIIDHATPRVFYYEVTHTETPEELAEVKRRLRETIEPGDVITFQTVKGGGHSMLCYDRERYMNCSQKEGFNGYHYTENRNVYHDNGGIYLEPLSNYYETRPEPNPGRHYLFAENIRRFAVHRPLDQVGDPTPDALARLSAAKDVVFRVKNNFPGGRTAAPGDEINYTLYARNKGGASRSITVSFAPGRGSEGKAQTVTLALPAGEESAVSFTARALPDFPFAAEPKIVAGGLTVRSRAVLIGKGPEPAETEAVLRAAEAALQAGSDVYAAVRDAYKALGITLPEDPAHYLRRLFFFHDSRAAEVVSRKEQLPEKDGCVYSYFGGRRVVTTEAPCFAGFRTTTILPRDFLPGDILLCSDDLFYERSYALVFTGAGFIGQPEAGAAPQKLGAEAAAAYLETLFGRFVFALIRPSMKERN